MTLAPGVKVLVTAGAAVGKTGVCLALWPRFWERGVPLWRVGFHGELVSERILRSDFLQPVEVT